MKKFWISFVLCMSILLNLPVLEVSAKNKPLRAPDGRLVLEGMSNIATDGDKIYYSLYGQQVGCYSIKQKKNLNEKLTVKEKRWGESGYEAPLSHFSVQGDYLYGMQMYSSGLGIFDNGGIYRRKKNGKKFTKLADGVDFLVSGKHIFYVKLEGIYDREGFPDWNGNSIWRMDLDGKNKKRIKYIKASRDTICHVSLYKSNKNIYYGYPIYNRQGKDHFKLFSLDGKRIKENFYIDHSNWFTNSGYSTDNFYLKDIKKRIDTNYTQIKVGSFKKGKWEFKTILNRKQESYWGAIGINRYIIIVKCYSNEEGDRIELYDINGKFIKTLKKGIFFAA